MYYFKSDIEKLLNFTTNDLAEFCPKCSDETLLEAHIDAIRTLGTQMAAVIHYTVANGSFMNQKDVEVKLEDMNL